MLRSLSSLALLCLLTLCAPAPGAHAGSAHEINVGVDETLDRFFYNIGGAEELAHKAVGVLVFPSVVKAGFGIGGEYGEGALRIRGRTVDYYNMVSASIGFQLGVQERSVIILFMTPEALDQFRRTAGLEDRRGCFCRHRYAGGWRLDRHQQDHEPGHRLHPRPQGAHVQSDARGLEDQPYQAVSVLSPAPAARAAAAGMRDSRTCR